MNKISTSMASTFYALMGTFFLLSAARDVFEYGVLLEWGMFIFLIVGGVLAYLIKATWVAYFSYVVLMFYNPLILSQISGKNSSIADICLGIAFFFMGLHITKFISSRS